MTTAELASAGAHDREQPAPAHGTRAEWNGRLHPAPAAVQSYLRGLVQDLRSSAVSSEAISSSRLPELLFAVQTRREFCYLSRARTAAYREAAQGCIARSLARGGPVHYCLDIGGGYHASLRPGMEPLSFGPGLGELLLLRQVRRVDTQVRHIYRPGIRFTLVIDNLVARLVNDIPVERTAAYCARLRELIAEAGMSDFVDLWIESEHLTMQDFEQLRPAYRSEPCPDSLTRKDHETVERFLGRACDASEAADRAARYREITGASGELIDSRISGLRMTQRATPGTICFRPFPGADSRIQSGEVALQMAADGKVSPLLLTSHNQHRFDWYRIDFSDMLPPAIEQVICTDPAVRAPS